MMDPRLSFRGPVLLGLAALLVFGAGLGSWLLLARLDSAVILSGQIIAEDHRQIIQHPEGGLVAEVLVREGSLVAAGDPLLRLDGTRLNSDLSILDGRLDGLAARAARLVAERDEAEAIGFPADLLARASTDPDIMAEVAGQRRHFELRLALFQEARDLLLLRISQLRNQAEGLSAQSAALSGELSLVQEALSTQEALVRDGLAPQSVILDLGRDAARLRGQIAELSVALSQTAEQITETELRIGGLRTERSEAAAAELREVEPEMLELAETRRALALRIDQLVIRAPISGTVLGLQVPRAQAVLRAGDPVLSLVPVDVPLVIAARVQSDDIDAIALDQPAELSLPAFAGTQVPRLKARVTQLAADALTDPDSGTAFYPVELTIEPGEMARLEGRSLRPGMRVEAFVSGGSRNPLTYLMEPFAVFFDHALKEG